MLFKKGHYKGLYLMQVKPFTLNLIPLVLKNQIFL